MPTYKLKILKLHVSYSRDLYYFHDENLLQYGTNSAKYAKVNARGYKLI